MSFRGIKLRLPGGRLYNALIAARKAAKENKYARIYWEWYKRFYVGGSGYARNICIPETMVKDDCFQFDTCDGKTIEIPITKEMLAFWYEFPDLLLPYIYNNSELVNAMYNEGPYELGKVCLSEGDVVIDCGANLGLFSAVASSKGCIAYAFEPSPSVRNEFLEKTSKKNGEFHIQPYALGAENEIVYFEEDSNNLGGGKTVSDGKTNVRVEMQTLDHWAEVNNISKIDFIKADIEGAERDMLKGAKRVLKELHPKLSICTYHLPDDKEVLERLILEAEPAYVIEHKFSKLYAYVPSEN